MAGTPNPTTWGPTEEFEVEARCCGYRRIAGLDEAGRGPLAGPVVAAAVVLPRRCRLAGLNDSKQVGEPDRIRLFAEIVRRARGIGIGSASEAEIDRLQYSRSDPIGHAARFASAPAHAGFSPVGRSSVIPGLSVRQRPIIKGDGLIMFYCRGVYYCQGYARSIDGRVSPLVPSIQFCRT